jgi:hypothetical protein
VVRNVPVSMGHILSVVVLVVLHVTLYYFILMHTFGPG